MQKYTKSICHTLKFTRLYVKYILIKKKLLLHLNNLEPSSARTWLPRLSITILINHLYEVKGRSFSRHVIEMYFDLQRNSEKASTETHRGRQCEFPSPHGVLQLCKVLPLGEAGSSVPGVPILFCNFL